MSESITKQQWHFIIFLSILMLGDALISIYGAWNYNSTFYEANPIFAYFGTSIESFAIAILVLKAAAVGVITVMIALLNDIEESLGDAAIKGGCFCFGGLLLAMTLLSAWASGVF